MIHRQFQHTQDLSVKMNEIFFFILECATALIILMGVHLIVGCKGQKPRLKKIFQVKQQSQPPWPIQDLFEGHPEIHPLSLKSYCAKFHIANDKTLASAPWLKFDLFFKIERTSRPNHLKSLLGSPLESLIRLASLKQMEFLNHFICTIYCFLH